jgi:oligopeptide transport system ATP-binding protein
VTERASSMPSNPQLAAAEPLLAVHDLHVQFFTRQGISRAVDGVTFVLNAGEVLALVGESGCGKSVTSMGILGLVPDPPGRIVRGRVVFRGRDLLTQRESELRAVRGNEIAMIFQDPLSSLTPYITVGRQIAEVLQLHRKLSRAAAHDEVVRLLGMVGIADGRERFDAYPHEFSGGMRQRVMIAMALACDPAVLIADEPTSSLDVTIQAQILELIATLRAKVGTAVLLISHDLGVVAGLADRVAVMYAGRIVEVAPTEQLYGNPQHPYTRGLLQALPRLDRRGPVEPIPGRPPRPLAVPGGCPFRPRCALAHEPCAGAHPPQVRLAGGHEVACWALEGRR